ncbi:IS4 family transposase [Arcicella aquatica]|uniref:IS4 family transposase n=1 Tax=Arcicella aquatica TaxID=217141 RepID=A0ABU5QWI9_9BACT|nr:IS4 family transposase [Arcicella aquatica]MEA5261069.1 IS4 family transposase [Arcicella aquatica]
MKNIIGIKIKDLFSKIPLAKNLARQKFISDFTLGVIKSRNVQFKEVGLHFTTDSKVESNERRIQAFFKDFNFDYQQVAILLIMFLPKGKLSLSIDRTEWDFGKYQCNILMIVARHDGVGIPIYWDLLDNRSGNSNIDNRKELIGKVISLIGVDRILVIVGDREFIGHQWIKYLKNNNIPFCMRMPKSHLITLRNTDTYSVFVLLSTQTERYYQDCMIDGVWCNIMLKKLPDGDFLILAGNLPAKQLGRLYRKRWSIEVFFQTVKGRGFNLENTHLKSSDKIKKLLVFVSIAVGICVNIGKYHHTKIQNIKTKKHGYKSNSFFRKGLDILREGFRNINQGFLKIWEELLNIFTRWIQIQLSHYQYLIKNIG